MSNILNGRQKITRMPPGIRVVMPEQKNTSDENSPDWRNTTIGRRLPNRSRRCDDESITIGGVPGK